MSSLTLPDDSALLLNTAQRVDVEQPTLTDAQRKQEPYNPVPNSIALDSSLSHVALRLWVVLNARAGRRGTVRVLQATLADDLGGVSTRTVRRALSELEERGYIGTDETGRSDRFTVANSARSERVSGQVERVSGHESPVRVDMGVHSTDKNVLDKKQSNAPSVDELDVASTPLLDPFYPETFLDGLPEASRPSQTAALSKCLEQAYANGWTAVDLSAACRRDMSNKQPRNPAGLLMSILRELSQQPASEHRVSETPIPPRFDAAAAESQRSSAVPMPDELRRQLQELSNQIGATA